VVERMFARMRDLVWTDPEEDAPAWHRHGVRAARVAWMAAEGFDADACSLRATALSLARPLALVPALAAAFAYVRGLGWSGGGGATARPQRAPRRWAAPE
jgi:hypothetical protein